MAPLAKGIDLVHVPKVVVQSVNTEHNGTPHRMIACTRNPHQWSKDSKRHIEEVRVLMSRTDLLLRGAARQNL